MDGNWLTGFARAISDSVQVYDDSMLITVVGVVICPITLAWERKDRSRASCKT